MPLKSEHNDLNVNKRISRLFGSKLLTFQFPSLDIKNSVKYEADSCRKSYYKESELVLKTVGYKKLAIKKKKKC